MAMIDGMFERGYTAFHPTIREFAVFFLAVQNSSISDLVPCLVCLTELTIRVFTTLQSEPRDLSPLRHLIRVMRRHDLTKKFYLPTYLPVHLP